MKKSRRITLLFVLFSVLYVFVFIYSIHAQRSAFKQSKAEILVSAGYSPTSNVIVWRESGRYYVNGQYCTDHDITSAIDSLIQKNEDYEMLQVILISFGLLCLLLFGTMYNQVKEVEECNESLKLQVLTQEEELNSITESSMLFFEQEAIRKKRATVDIYDYAADRAHPLSGESSGENESEDFSSEDNKSEEAEESEE
mgnify:FL=1